MSALLINETFLNTFLRTQKSGFALKSAFLSGFTLLRAFLSAQKSAQGPAQPLWLQTKISNSFSALFHAILNLASVSVLQVGHNLDDFTCGQNKIDKKKRCNAVNHLGGSWVCWQPGRTTAWWRG